MAAILFLPILFGNIFNAGKTKLTDSSLSLSYENVKKLEPLYNSDFSQHE